MPIPELLSPFLGEASLLLQYGERHKRDRKLLTPPLHGSRMRAYGRLMREAALRHTAHWKPGRPFTLLETTQAISLEVITRAVFGVVDDGRVAVYEKALTDYVGAMTAPLIYFKSIHRRFGGFGPWARFDRARQALFRLLDEDIDRAQRDTAPREDILSLMLSARYEDGEALSRVEVRDQLLTLLFAGHESTAVTFAWAPYYLHRDRAALERVKAELKPLADVGRQLEVAPVPRVREARRNFSLGPKEGVRIVLTGDATSHDTGQVQ